MYTSAHASKYFTDWLASKGFREDQMMTRPPIKFLIEDYAQGKQYTSLTSIWDSVLAASPKIGHK